MKKLLLGLSLALLAACSSPLPDSQASTPQTPQVPEIFSVSAGTSSYADRVGLSIMFEVNLDTPVEELRVSVLGPGNWNSGRSSRRVYKDLASGRFVTWFKVTRDNDGELMDAIDGTYIVQTVLDGVTLRQEVDVDVSTKLAVPGGLDVVGDENAIAVTWADVPEAESYLVTLRAENEDVELDRYVYAGSATAQFSDLSLIDGERYKIGLTALTTDFTEGSGRELSNSFMTSYASTTILVQE